MRELHLFAGAGGGILGGLLCGHVPVCAVELEEYPRRVLLQRQRDGVLPWFPVWDDVCTFDGRPWRGAVDLIAGGFPCQDISSAGTGKGLNGERSGLWREFARIIREVGPRFVLVENSPRLASRGLDQILGELAEMGFDAKWGVLGAHHTTAPHPRERIWILAQRQDVPDTQSHRHWQGRGKPHLHETHGRQIPGGIPKPAVPGWWATEPELGRVAHGVAHQVDRLRAIGNGQVPAVARLAFNTLLERMALNV